MTIPPDFESLNELLEHDQMGSNAAELQGSLCAQLTMGDTSVQDWLDNALGQALDETMLDMATGEALVSLYQWTRSALSAGELGFKLFLPDDDLSLGERTEALTHWCNGYLSGLGLSGINEQTELPDDAREFLQDIGEISRADFLTEDAEEEDEVGYMELVEYARVGVMLVYETLRGPDSSESIH